MRPSPRASLAAALSLLVLCTGCPRKQPQAPAGGDTHDDGQGEQAARKPRKPWHERAQKKFVKLNYAAPDSPTLTALGRALLRAGRPQSELEAVRVAQKLEGPRLVLDLALDWTEPGGASGTLSLRSSAGEQDTRTPEVVSGGEGLAEGAGPALETLLTQFWESFRGEMGRARTGGTPPWAARAQGRLSKRKPSFVFARPSDSREPLPVLSTSLMQVFEPAAPTTALAACSLTSEVVGHRLIVTLQVSWRPLDGGPERSISIRTEGDSDGLQAFSLLAGAPEGGLTPEAQQALEARLAAFWQDVRDEVLEEERRVEEAKRDRRKVPIGKPNPPKRTP